MKQPLALSLAAALAAASTGAGAAEFNYNRLQVGVGDIELDGGADGDGLLLDGSLSVLPNVFVVGGYRAWDFDGPADRDDFYLGAGAHAPINASIDLVGQLTYEERDVDVDGPGRGGEDDGLGLRGGIRAQVAPRVELAGGAYFYEFDEGDDEVGLYGEGWYTIQGPWRAGIKTEIGDEQEVLSINGEFQF